jgi:hypothetical protein
MRRAVIAMLCNLYSISADDRQLIKVIEETTPVTTQKANIKPTAEVDIINPTFIFDNPATVLTCNYLYCDTFSRWYYITNISVDTAQRAIVECKIDVLQTYAQQIKNSVATILRSESIGQPTKYIDNKLPVYPSKKNVTSIVMSQISVPLNSQLSTTDGDNYLLTVVGGTPTF